MNEYNGKYLKLIYSPGEIAQKVSEIAGKIDALYGQEDLVIICVLKGAFIFCADLVRKIKNANISLDFISLSSYGIKMESSGKVSSRKNLDADIKDRHVLIVEDIVDSGVTMKFLLEKLQFLEPASLRIAVLLDKIERRKTDITIDFACFRTGNGFFVGYGLDYGEKYRNLPGIYEYTGPAEN